jgi:hypothetical protein
MIKGKIFSPHITIPQDHGSWVFLLSPLLIGLFASGRFSMASAFLTFTSLAAFFLRQPFSILVKVLSGRRPRADLPGSLAWSALYALLVLAGTAGLIASGYSRLLILSIPAVLVFALHMYLVSRRAERRQAGVEIAASGVLALAAPAAYWIGHEDQLWQGLLLWGLVWMQSAASIVHAYLRLNQRVLQEYPSQGDRWRMGGRALLYTSFNLAASLVCGLTGLTSGLLFLPYTVQWLETLWGILHPAVGVKPTRIGIRQLLISTLFTILFILIWR